MIMNPQLGVTEEVEAIVSTYRDLVKAEHYLRATEPLAKLWAYGGEALIHNLYEEAIRVYEAKPNDATSLIFAANLVDYMSADMWRTAVEYLSPRLPAHPFTDMIIGNYLARTGGKDKAKPHFDRALAMGAGNPDIVATCAYTYGIDLDEGDRALALINQVIEAMPDVAWFHVVRGDILRITLKDHAAALKDFEHAVALSPDHYPFRNMRAYANIALGNHAAAIDDLEFALKANPNSPNGRFAMLTSALRTGDLHRAADALLAPRTKLISRGQLALDTPLILTFTNLSMYWLTLNASGGERVTITAETDNALFLSPFIALVDPSGELIAHSTLYDSFGDEPEARTTADAALSASGTYRVVFCHNLSTWGSLGEGDMRVTLTLADRSGAAA